jgi:lysyl-tRNA synthetase class 2
VTYRPGAAIDTLRQRAAMLAAIRTFFAERHVLEVETPALSSAGVTDPAIESIVATVRSLGAAPQYLHTSPEFAMKRLLAAGSGDIYQVCRVFRDDELGRWHQPEFTLLEWYRVGWDEQALMTEVAELVATACAAGGRTTPARAVRMTYAQALENALGLAPDAPTPELLRRLAAKGIDAPPGLEHDAVLDLAFGTVVVAGFDPDALTLVFDYPATQAALARLKATSPAVAARFEAFCGGIELANGFHELTDAREQRRRFVSERERRLATGRPAPPLDEQLLAALPSLPDCAGVALGFDRLVALATRKQSVAEVVSFVQEGKEGTDL